MKEKNEKIIYLVSIIIYSNIDISILIEKLSSIESLLTDFVI